MPAQSTTVSDLAGACPLSYAELAELNRAGALAARLAAMTPRERVGAAAVVAEATGREMTSILDRFARLIAEAEPQGPPPASAAAVARRGELVASESTPGLFYIVRGAGSSCTCPGFRYRGRCKHTARARAARVAGVVNALQARRTARILAA